MHRSARRTAPRESLRALQKLFRKRKTLARARGFFEVSKLFAYLPVGQVLEIIFTFCTVKVGCDPEAPAPEEPVPVPVEEPAPVEEADEPDAPLELPDAAPLPSDPVRRTSCPTCSVNLEVSPASCQVFPVVSVSV